MHLRSKQSNKLFAQILPQFFRKTKIVCEKIKQNEENQIAKDKQKKKKVLENFK